MSPNRTHKNQKLSKIKSYQEDIEIQNIVLRNDATNKHSSDISITFVLNQNWLADPSKPGAAIQTQSFNPLLKYLYGAAKATVRTHDSSRNIDNVEQVQEILNLKGH